MRTLLIALLLVVPSLACATEKKAETPAVTQPGQSEALNLRPKVLALLQAMEGTPSVEQWKQLGPEALTVLRQIAADPAELPTRRARAAASMAYVDNPAASDTIKGLASDVNALPLVRKSAVLALAARDGTNAVPALTGLLADNDLDVRSASARALGSAGGAGAKTALQSRLDTETDPKVRDEIQKSLAKIAN
jgi:HEAT repeat protein